MLEKSTAMIWYSGELSTNLANQLREAIKYMKKKYGVDANICYLNPKYTEQAEKAGNINLILTKQVATGQLFIGREE